jgi:hypothetical protein
MFYELFKELTIAFILTMVVNAIVYAITRDIRGALFFGAGSLAYFLIWFFMVIRRAKQVWEQEVEGDGEEKRKND